jgi:hypothetical protein
LLRCQLTLCCAGVAGTSPAALLELQPLPPLSVSSGSVTKRDKLPVRLIIVHSDGSAAPKEVRYERGCCTCACD